MKHEYIVLAGLVAATTFAGNLEYTGGELAISPKAVYAQEAAQTVLSDDIMTIGANPTERYFTWHANTTEAGVFTFAEVKDGAVPADGFKGTDLTATTEKTNDTTQTANKVHLTGLKPNTTYAFQYKNGETASEVQTFKTGGTDSFSFFLAGDPQIGSGGTSNEPQNGLLGWDRTLNYLKEIDPDADFLQSAGDNVNTAYDEEEYREFLNRDGFNGVTFAPAIGNHDSWSQAYNQHFQVPNEGERASDAGGDYYYTYNNTLFIVLNSNDWSLAKQKAFLENAIEETKDQNIRWKVVVFHHAPYSSASHSTDGDIKLRRNELSPVFTDLKIDLVLNGHDHVYDRTYIMQGTEPTEKGIVKDGYGHDVYQDPDGVVYVTANSASGSKYYYVKKKYDYAKVTNQEFRPNITHISVEKDRIALKTYRTGASTMSGFYRAAKDDLSIVDEFSITKTPAPLSELKVDFVIKDADKAKGSFVKNEAGGVNNTLILPSPYDASKLAEQAPKVEAAKGYTFVGWDKAFTGTLTENTVYHAVFAPDSTSETPTEPERPTNPGWGGGIFMPPAKDDKPVDEKPEDKKPVEDVEGKWSEESVNRVIDLGLMDLIDGKFRPLVPTDRLTVVKALARMQKINLEDYRGKSLKDIEAGSDESAYINWAQKYGIINGYEDGTFRPDHEITREEIAKILITYAKAFDVKGKELPALRFTDDGSIGKWAKEYVKEATERGLLKGHASGAFGPKENLKRQEVAQILVNILDM